jgi:dolichol-phosphate mannosyltransferase
MTEFKTKNPVAVSVILPTYNEKETILPLIRALSTGLSGVDYQIIVVDDDSPDGTWRLVQTEYESNPAVKIIRRTSDKGLRSSLNTGISASRSEVVIFMDSDFQHPPDLVPELLSTITQGADVALGSRFIRNGARDKRLGRGPDHVPLNVLVHGWLSLLLSRTLNMLMAREVSDWTSGMVAVRREIFDHYTLRGYYGECFIGLVEHCIHKRYRIVEVPYTLELRRQGTSKTSGDGWLRLMSLGLRYVLVVVRVLWKRYTRN